MIKDKPRIKITLTRSRKLRARVEPKNAPAYEVTIGGESWCAGKGIQDRERILTEAHRALTSILKQMKRVL